MAEYRSPQSEPGNEQRFLLVILVMAAVIFGAQFLLRKNTPAPAGDNSKQAQQLTPAAQATSSAPSAPASKTQTPPASAKAPKQVAASKQAEAETETVVENDFYRITFTNRGAHA